MTDEDGVIKVDDTKGRIRRVPTPSGFSDLAFRNIVNAYDGAYRHHGRTPSLDEVHAMWPRIPKATYSKAFVTPEFADALAYRGIDFNVDSGLSIEQSMALAKLLDFGDRRGTAAKLRELGIPMARYEAWMKQPLFKETYRRRVEDQTADASTLALAKLVQNVDSGDQRAVEFALQVTGRYNPAQQQIADVRTIVTMVVEAIIAEVDDTDVRRKIMSRIETAMMGHVLVERQQQIGT